MKNRITAAVLAFFLGGLGVHRFYLGQGGIGILHLLFFWTFIPAVISLVDGVIFLTMSDQNFDLKYNRLYLMGNAPQQTIVIHNNQHNAAPVQEAQVKPNPNPNSSSTSSNMGGVDNESLV